jgi:hypothetical protein
MKKKIYYCPEEDFSCPYFNKRSGACGLEDPVNKCDAFFGIDENEDFVDEEEEEPDDFPD